MVIYPHKAYSKKTIWSRTTTVAIKINASPDVIWSIMTDAEDFSRWNSTIISLKGNIVLGKQIKIKSNLNLEKKSVYKVSTFLKNNLLCWHYGHPLTFRSIISFQLMATESGEVIFVMKEKLDGLLAPFILGYIPEFDATFDQFVLDLKNEAELIHKADKIINSLKK